MSTTLHLSVVWGEALDEAAFTPLELARACRVPIEWVHARVSAGLLQPDQDAGDGQTWRFGSATLVQARRMASLETTFDADPELAALTADLIAEVLDLRRRLRVLERRG